MKHIILLPLILLVLGSGPLTFAQSRPAATSFSGVWLRSGGAGGGAGGAERAPQRLPVSQWSAEQLPFTPAGLAKLNANKSGKGPRAVMPRCRRVLNKASLFTA